MFSTPKYIVNIHLLNFRYFSTTFKSVLFNEALVVLVASSITVHIRVLKFEQFKFWYYSSWFWFSQTWPINNNISIWDVFWNIQFFFVLLLHYSINQSFPECYCNCKNVCLNAASCVAVVAMVHLFHNRHHSMYSVECSARL